MNCWIHRTNWLVVSALAGLVSPPSASAVVLFSVDSVLDQIDDNTADGACHTAANTCTLRAAVMQANLIVGEDTTIVLPAGTYGLTLPPSGANGADTGDLNLTTPVGISPWIAIVGAGEATTIIDANQLDRVLTVAVNRSATLARLTLRNGLRAGAGVEYAGGILNLGTLVLNYCTVSGNAMTAFSVGGGGIYNNGGIFHLNDSTVSGNTTNASGGGIYNTGTLLVTRSTVTGNTALGPGGGIYDGHELVVTDSTISLNTTHNDGGGILSFGVPAPIILSSTISLNDAYRNGGGIYSERANIYSSTIVANGADYDADVTGGIGGGVYANGAGPFNLSNTLVAGNTQFNQPIYDDCFGQLTSYRRNLFGEVSIFCTISVGGGDGWTFINSLAFLGQLDKNGGPTETIALLPGSNAIDLGDSTLGCTGPVNEVLAADQRGAPRAWGVRCDVGAYEAGTLFFDGFESGDFAGW